MKRSVIFPLCLSAAALLLTTGYATAQAISYTTPGALYGQNFDTLAASGRPAWADQTTLAGWRAYFSTTATAPADYLAYNGGSSSAGLYSLGNIGSTNRALGIAPSSGFGNGMIGVSFVNNTSDILDTISISYKGELWRGVGTGAKALIVSYQIGNSDTLHTGSWTDIAALTFNAPQTAGGTAYDGTLEINSALLSTTLSGLNWEVGQTLTIRFFQTNDAYNKYMAIDDFAFTATAAIPEPGTWALLASSAAGLFFLRRRSGIRQQG